jgi:hypothetical protein
MRMPVLPYVLVVGAVLLGLLLWTSDDLPSDVSAIKTSQLVGLPKSELPREPSEPLMTTANFAAEEAPPARSGDTSLKQEKNRPTHHSRVPHERKAESRQLKTRTNNRLAEFQQDNWFAWRPPLTQTTHSLW